MWRTRLVSPFNGWSSCDPSPPSGALRSPSGALRAPPSPQSGEATSPVTSPQSGEATSPVTSPQSGEASGAMKTDILVIGDGLAGSAAALEAARLGASVALVSAEHGCSDRAQGGIAAATLPEDSPGLHALDTIAAGGVLCDPSAVAMLTAAGPPTVIWLESLGVRFDGGAAREAAHSLPRVLHLGGDQSGSTLMGFMRTAIDHEPNITRYRARFQSLIVDQSCGGAVFSGGLVVHAGATVLATGGYGGLFGRTTNSRISNGKGILEEARAGARVADLEFVQFHPHGFDGPASFPITHAPRGAGPRSTTTESNSSTSSCRATRLRERWRLTTVARSSRQ